MRKGVIAICLIAGLGIVGLGYFRPIFDCDADSWAIVDWPVEWLEANKQAQHEIGELGTNRSSNPAGLLEEFSKRFALTTMAERRGGPRDIRSITATGGGDRYELVFVLRHLFTWNGLDAEEVNVVGAQQAGSSGRNDRWLVYVPTRYQYFDPTLRPSEQPKGFDRALFGGKRRIHTVHPSAISVHGCGFNMREFNGMMWPFSLFVLETRVADVSKPRE